MPILAISQTATVNITSPNGYIVVTCATGDVMQVDWSSPGSVSGARTVRQVTEDVGPFADGTVITLRAMSGSPQYTDGLGGGLTTAQTAALLALLAGGGTTGLASPVSISAPGGTGPGSALTALIGQGWAIDAYQWTRNDAAIAGEITSTHNIVALDAGTVLGAQGLRASVLIYTDYLAIPGAAFHPNQVFFNGAAIYFNSQSVGFS